MNNHPRQSVYGIVSVCCTVLIVYLFSKIIPLGMGGQIGQARGYIFLSVVLFLIAIPSAFMYQVSRLKPEDDPELTNMRMQMDALSQKAEIIKKTEQKADDDQSKRSAST